jgi:hypothetical protein
MGVPDSSRSGSSTLDECAEVTLFVKQDQRLARHKAKAMIYLLERDYTITLDDINAADA